MPGPCPRKVNPWYNEPKQSRPTSKRETRGTWGGNPYILDGPLDNIQAIDIQAIAKVQQERIRMDMAEVARRNAPTVSGRSGINHLNQTREAHFRDVSYHRLLEDRHQRSKLSSLVRSEMEDEQDQDTHSQERERQERERERGKVEEIKRQERRKKQQEQYDDQRYVLRLREQRMRDHMMTKERDIERKRIMTARCDAVRQEQIASGGREREQRMRVHQWRKTNTKRKEREEIEIESEVEIEIEIEKDLISEATTLPEATTLLIDSKTALKDLKDKVLELKLKLKTLKGKAKKNMKTKLAKLLRKIETLE